MTILPKKKSDQERDSDSEHSSSPSPTPRGPVRSHSHAHGSPLPIPSDEGGYHHSPTDGYYHRCYDSGSSSGDSSPELPPLGKRSSYRPPSTAATARGKKPPDSSPYYSGYNSAEEHEGPRRPYPDYENERKFELLLKKERGFVIKKMRPDGACLFRAVSDQVYGDQEMHSVVRNHCLDYMLKNADYFSQYVTEDFEQYINRKRSDQCYGNNLEMQAIAEMYNRAIEVFQYSTEPINIFFCVYKTDNAPIRLSYHGGVHYNSVVDPYQATVGVGLGLAGYKPGLADKMMVSEALRNSENGHLERTMLEDKLRSTDWEATYDAIEEAVARESYLSWLREQEHKVHSGKQGAQSTSAAGGGFPPTLHHPLPPPMATTSTSTSSPLPSPPPTTTTTHAHTATAATTTTGGVIGSHGHGNYCTDVRGSPLYTTTGTDSKLGGSRISISPTSSRRGSHRGTPSPTVSHRGSLAGNQHGSVRNSPYGSPRTSPRSSLRGSPHHSTHGSPRNSHHGSPHSSPRSSVHGSPPPVPLVLGSSTELRAGAHSPVRSPTGSPPAVVGKPLLVSEGSGQQSLDSPATRQLPGAALSPSSHQPPGSQSPPHTVDFESGRVLSRLPYEYSSFLDLPPSAFGLSEWEDDRILAAVLAASQQEYIDSLRQNSRGAESL